MDRNRMRQQQRSRSRSRSRSPEQQSSSTRAGIIAGRQPHGNNNGISLERQKLERERRDRMLRLRAENDEEEQQMTALTNPGGMDSTVAGNPSAKEAIIEVDDEELEGLDEEEQMQKLLGFGGFDTTKGKKIQDNHDSLAKGSAAKNKARKYRQYMNRKGGFNKPLDKMH